VSRLRPGQRLDPYVVESVDSGRMKTMALLLRDPNPIHFDTDVNERLGLGDRAINQGPINMSYLIELAQRAAGSPIALRRFRVRFLGNVLAGQRVECTGVVVSVDEAAGTAELELAATADGDRVLEAVATVAVPASP